LAAAIGFEPVEVKPSEAPQLIKIGTLRPFAGIEFPAFLTLAVEPADVCHALESILLECDSPFIVLSPTATKLVARCDVLLKRRPTCFVTLTEALKCDDEGRWSATAEAVRKLSNFQGTVVPQATESNPLVFFPTPANAVWNHLRIKFVDGETVSVKVGDATGRLLFSQMGMADGRTAKPTKQWELLKEFARGLGTMTWSSPGATRKNQKRKELLSDNLKAFFRIDGEPFRPTANGQGWHTNFSVEPDA
jgi:hypothetical protein